MWHCRWAEWKSGWGDLWSQERGQSYCTKQNISNKLQDFETVSQRRRHRSNHTQKIIPSVVAGHQFLQFCYIGPDNGLFPVTMWHIQASAARKSDSLFSKTFLLQNCFFRICLCLWNSCLYWQSSYSRRLAKASPLLVGRIGSAPLSLFREGIADNHHPKPEWHHISCRLLCNTWQIPDFKQIFIWN